MTQKRITIVGCGPGAPGYLTDLARQAIGRAEVLAGARRLLDLFPEAPGERIVIGAEMSVSAALDALAILNDGRAIVVLVTGDPGVASLARPVIRRFGLAACTVIPGISSVQVAFARLGIEWYDARIINAHGVVPALDAATLAAESKIAVLAGGRASLAWTADLADALGSAWRCHACEDLTLETENVREVTPAALRADAFSPRTIVILVREDAE